MSAWHILAQQPTSYLSLTRSYSPLLPLPSARRSPRTGAAAQLFPRRIVRSDALSKRQNAVQGKCVVLTSSLGRPLSPFGTMFTWIWKYSGGPGRSHLAWCMDISPRDCERIISAIVNATQAYSKDRTFLSWAFLRSSCVRYIWREEWLELADINSYNISFKPGANSSTSPDLQNITVLTACKLTYLPCTYSL